MLAGVVYRWWWLLQDFFHLGGGVVLLTAAVGLLCTVTSKFQAMQPLVVQLLLESGCPPMKAASCGSLISAEPVGMHVLNKVLFVDVSKAVAFALVLLLIVLTQLLDVLNGLDYGSRGLAPDHTAAVVGGAASGPVQAVGPLEGLGDTCDVSQLSKEARADLLGQIINKLVAG
mmetsp:Transcript_37845/g.99326  ORF Transcript_37845/g.99326 Transcript_37845/m.99326 type:complete len:173 (-) Transcript_37845:339-857(-)